MFACQLIANWFELFNRLLILSSQVSSFSVNLERVTGSLDSSHDSN